jgi:hypothetical protein
MPKHDIPDFAFHFRFLHVSSRNMMWNWLLFALGCELALCVGFSWPKKSDSFVIGFFNHERDLPSRECITQFSWKHIEDSRASLLHEWYAWAMPFVGRD